MWQEAVRPLPLMVDRTQRDVTIASTRGFKRFPNHRLDAETLEQFEFSFCFEGNVVQIGQMERPLLLQLPDQPGILVRDVDTGKDRSVYAVTAPLVANRNR